MLMRLRLVERQHFMRQLIIEYVFEGHKRGYNFTSPTDGVSDEHQRTIWRQTMPRGQGWGAFIGATSLKCFPLDEDTVAVAEITVTDLADDGGRKGIRRAVVDVMSDREYVHFLRARWEAYSTETRTRAEEKLTFCRKSNIIHKTMPKFRRDSQLIFVYPYRSAENWQTVEAFCVHLALEPLAMMRRWGEVIPFTTLALDYREESKMVALPATKRDLIDVPHVPLSRNL